MHRRNVKEEHPPHQEQDKKKLHPLAAIIERYLHYLTAEKNLSLKTVENYQRHLDVFLQFDPPPHPEKIDADTVRAYKVFLRTYSGRPSSLRSDDGHLKSTTVNVYLIALRGFLRYLALQEDMEVLPPGKIELLRTGDRPIKVLTDEQIDNLLAAPGKEGKAHAVRDRAILELLFSTGARVSELTRLNRDDVNFKTREMSILGKRRKIRVVFITDIAAEAVEEYLQARSDTYKPLFLRTAGPKSDPTTDAGESLRLTTRSIWNIVRHYALAAGLVTDPSPHTLRHTLATVLLRRGADLRSVQEILGHEDVSTTQIYTHVTNPQLKEVHKKFHPRNK